MVLSIFGFRHILAQFCGKNNSHHMDLEENRDLATSIRSIDDEISYNDRRHDFATIHCMMM
jgi:hypothetical protein